jgi:hypothetical protein
MRKDSISKEALDRVTRAYTQKRTTDYARGTILQPDVETGLRPSFGEYENLGKEHSALTQKIESLNDKMKLSRQRGAFKALQEQMKEVKNLVKQREDIDSKMATLDLARKKTDDHLIATRQELSYSEKLESVSQRLASLEELLQNLR